MRALDSQGHGLADAEATGAQSPTLEPASPSVKAALERGLGGVCTLAGGHGEAGHCLTQDGRHPACPEPEGWRVCACRLDQAGADILAPVGLLDGSVCAD